MMEPVGNLLTTRPLQTDLECTIEWYLGCQFICINTPYREVVHGSVPTQTRTRSGCSQPLETLTPVGMSIWELQVPLVKFH
jgi:hypothetical protein